ncbi:hypothetical protein NQ315_007758 [Exocentrus adspersus]|uniref:WW domain-containing protein n=1 Tax=Exocentrus adspersus TaxID=1586481 RepID=A0AAV8W8F9_9CUCU|nr:hypothetical protein NQ315_007758 [Exocentrus adspersus]
MPRKRNGEIPLPEGWDFGRDKDGKIYFIDHISKKNYVDRSERQAKKDIYHIKSQRLLLAQDEYDHLNNALASLTTSRTSCK